MPVGRCGARRRFGRRNVERGDRVHGDSTEQLVRRDAQAEIALAANDRFRAMDLHRDDRIRARLADEPLLGFELSEEPAREKAEAK